MYDPLKDPSRNTGFRDTFFDLDFVYDPFDDPEEDFEAWIRFLYEDDELDDEN